MKSLPFILSYFFLLAWSPSLLAEEVYRSAQPPSVLSAEIGDSDIVFEADSAFSIRFTKEVLGTQAMSEEQKQALLDKVKVVYDPASGRLKVETPKIVIGRVIARVTVGSFQPLAIRLRGDDGDVKFVGASLSTSEIRLQDGDIEAQQVKIYGDSSFQTVDGDIQIYRPQLVGEIDAKSTGDGKVRRHAEAPVGNNGGDLQLITRDGNITVY